MGRVPRVVIVIGTRRYRLMALVMVVLAASFAFVTWSVTTANGAASPRLNVSECLQAQLQGAIEQRGGGGYTYIPLGYTFLIVNVGTKSCELRGYPYEVIFSTTTGAPVKVSISMSATCSTPSPRLSASCFALVGSRPSVSVTPMRTSHHPVSRRGASQR